MKKTIFTAFLSMLLLLCMVNRTAAQTFLDVGTTVSDYPKVTWLKGEAITKFEKDKIYVVELWATWCVPCIAAMPHMNALAQKFKDKGVVFIGQNVMEEDLEKVKTFVEKKGEGMSYHVAFGGAKGNEFEKTWLEAAGINSIPQTFLVQNNKLVWITTPYQLNEQVLDLLVAGKFTIAAATALTENR